MNTPQRAQIISGDQNEFYLWLWQMTYVLMLVITVLGITAGLWILYEMYALGIVYKMH
jgi:hypothetical protein